MHKNSLSRRQLLLRFKALGRSIVCSILEAQVRRLRARHQFTVIAVAGSVGKTSTKMAIAKTLQASRKVQWQEGNYNDRVTVPLIFFGHIEPNILNIWAWLKIFLKNEGIIRHTYPYEVVVVELGTDGPGFMQEFAYTRPDLAVVTAVVPEHMEFFGTLDAVAAEELGIFDFSKQVLVNIDDTPVKYLQGRQYSSFSLHQKASYQATQWQQLELRDGTITIALPDESKLQAGLAIVGEPGAKITLAAAATAHMVGLADEAILQGLTNIKPFAGRMQILSGVHDSIIIDDTYNASPPAVEAALDVLYAATAPQRIAILGSMNQLGDYSPEAHQEVGAYCDAKKLDLVVTIGAAAKQYLAPAAQVAGCEVHNFPSPYQAGEFVKSRLKTGAIVLAEGSQDGVYAEESLKCLLQDPGDQAKLVRQSARWMRIKQQQFPR